MGFDKILEFFVDLKINSALLLKRFIIVQLFPCLFKIGFNL